MSDAQLTHVVRDEHTARAVGSGDLDVLGTPVVLAWLEAATCAALELDAAQTSVGTRVEIQHLTASPVGATITASATQTQRDGRLVVFDVAAHDQQGTLVAAGTVRRIVVERERFLARLPRVEQ